MHALCISARHFLSGAWCVSRGEGTTNCRTVEAKERMACQVREHSTARTVLSAAERSVTASHVLRPHLNYERRGMLCDMLASTA